MAHSDGGGGKDGGGCRGRDDSCEGNMVLVVEMMGVVDVVVVMVKIMKGKMM